MLDTATLVAFAPTLDLEQATAFYGGTLGLRLVTEFPGAAVFDANGTSLRVTLVNELTPDPFTVLGWEVDDIVTTVAGLTIRGVEFLRFDGMPQDAAGIWTTPGGDKVAWFHDPDGNTLSVSSHT